MAYYKAKYKKGIKSTHSCLLYEWDFYWNSVDPFSITAGSHKDVWWVCSVCCHRWVAKVYNRAILNKGCPACSGRVITDFNNLRVLYPEISKLWCYKKNGGLLPENVVPGSGKKVWWVCNQCGTIKKIAIRDKVKTPLFCKTCTSLSSVCPELIKEWSSKNKTSPYKIGAGSNVKVWWECSKCGNEWCCSIYHRTGKSKSGCPYCARQRISSMNSLFSSGLDILSEWDYEKNVVTPKEVSSGSGKKVWWVCEKGHSWKTFIYHRARNNRGCPYCSLGQVSTISQEWLDRCSVLNVYREYKIQLGGRFFKVDGFDPKTNTVYEFLGDFWHGNPDVYDACEINPVSKKSFGDLYEKTFDRFSILEKAGYNVVFIWENDFKNSEVQV